MIINMKKIIILLLICCLTSISCTAQNIDLNSLNSYNTDSWKLTNISNQLNNAVKTKVVSQYAVSKDPLIYIQFTNCKPNCEKDLESFLSKINAKWLLSNDYIQNTVANSSNILILKFTAKDNLELLNDYKSKIITSDAGEPGIIGGTGAYLKINKIENTISLLFFDEGSHYPLNMNNHPTPFSNIYSQYGFTTEEDYVNTINYFLQAHYS